MPVLRRVVPLVVALSSLLGAQPAPAPSAAAFDPARLARLDSTLRALVADRKLPGVVALVVHDGTVAYHAAHGTRDVRTNAPLRRDDIFRIASQTKAITSLAAMMLWEEGKFSLDDPVARWLPEFDSLRVLTKFDPRDSTYESRPARRRMTVRQLFTHTSGLDYADIGSDEFRAIYAKAGITGLGREGEVLAERIRVLGKLPLRHDPGERFTYSLSIDVLGRLVEVWSGMPLDRFVRTRIAAPLRMDDTFFELPADRRARLVALHGEEKGVLTARREQEGGMRPDYPARPVTYFAGGAGLSGSIGDYARFLQLVLNGGTLDGVRLLSRKTVELMLTDQIPTLGFPFGLGFALETKDNDFRSILTQGSFSWGGAFNTTYWVDPKEKLVVLAYANVYPSSVRLEEIMRTLVYSALR
jgi:CubicO group peptidase (beta-lactamase class C family)